MISLDVETVELAVEARQAACGMLFEDPYTQELVDSAVSWWAKLQPSLPWRG